MFTMGKIQNHKKLFMVEMIHMSIAKSAARRHKMNGFNCPAKIISCPNKYIVFTFNFRLEDFQNIFSCFLVFVHKAYYPYN